MPSLSPRKPEQSHWYVAMASSTVLHSVALVVLGLWHFSRPVDTSADVDSRWVAETAPEEFSVELLPQDEIVETETSSPSSSLAAGAQSPAPPTDPRAISAIPIATGGLVEGLTEEVGAAPTGSGVRSGTEGDGGDGNGFFGLTARGERVVFVVDCSRSMNAPHQSEAKTRFNRVRIELVNAIGGMQAEQQFFVVFFNNHAVPMPATSMQFATPVNQQVYLRWVAQLKAQGQPTDPREALALALRLSPDTIYFLTDGDLDLAGVRRDLRKLRQSRSRIHTFAFGSADGEELLKILAQNNGGEYKFIP